MISLDGIATVAMNAYTAYKLFTQRRQSNNALDSRDTEISLFIFTCFLFASTLVSIVCQVNYYVVRKMNLQKMKLPKDLGIKHLMHLAQKYIFVNS